MKAVLVLGVLSVTGPAFAQAPAIMAVKVDVSRVSTPTVIAATVTIPIASSACNLVASPVPPVTLNPGQAEYDDPANPTRVCRANVAALLAALPAADYTATGSYVYADGTVGGSSTSGPFTRWDPQILRGFRIVR